MFKRDSNNWHPYFAAPDSTGDSGGLSGEMSKDDIIDYLSGDDDDASKPDDADADEDVDDKKKPAKAKDKETSEKSDKSDKKKKSDKETTDDADEDSEDDDDSEDTDLDELEEDLEDIDPEKLDLVTPVRRSQILKKYPNIFKDFPYLEKAYFREQQFTEIFPHPDDAKQALEKATTLDKFETDLFSGNTQTVLTAIKNETPRAFAKLVDNYLPTLAKVDQEAYHHVIGNTIKQTIMAMVGEGRKSNNETLQQAAQILNQFVFGSSDFVPPTNLAREEKPDEANPELTQLKAERSQRVRQQFNDTREDLNTRVSNSLKATIEANIDPKGSMTDYVKRNATRDAMETIDKLIDTDKRFKTIVDKLWERSFRENFSKSSVEQIRSAYLSKAKTLLDSVIKKSRNEALRGIGKRVKEDTNDKTPKKGADKNEQPRSNKSGGKSSGVPAGMSSLEFLMQDD